MRAPNATFSVASLLVMLVALVSAAAFAQRTEPAPASLAPGTASAEPMAAHAPNVASYRLRATLDPKAHVVHGEGTITFTNPAKVPIDEVWLHLYLNAFKNQSSVFMRTPIGGFRGTTIPADWGTIDLKRFGLAAHDGEGAVDLLPKIERHRPDDDDETDARVPLPALVAPGSTITFDVEWDDKLPSVVERTGYDGSFHMIAQWFPKLAVVEPDGKSAHFPFHHLGEFYADFGTYDVTLDVPVDFTVGATGPVTETKTENGRRIERHVQSDIHDFAWTAWDKWKTRKETIANVEVNVLFPPGYDDHAERELETMRFALPYYGARYGAYPYGLLTVVHPPASAPEAGGMEYPTLITTGQPSWLPRGLHFVEGVTIHEFGHQYFYGLLASNEVAWPFLDEGLNSYAEVDAMTAWKGAGAGLDFLGLRVGEAEAQAERARHYTHDEPVAQSAADFRSGTAYAALVYSRTATVFETLARVYGRDKIEAALGIYARRFRFRHPTPDDLLGVVREVLGEEVAKNLRRALFEKGWVDYGITATSSHPSHPPAGLFDRDGKRETVRGDKTPGQYSGWVLVTRRGDLSFPVEIELRAEDGSRKRVLWEGTEPTRRFPYVGASPLQSAIVDPDQRVLLDQHPDDNFATAASRPSAGAPRTFERASFWGSILAGGFGP